MMGGIRAEILEPWQVELEAGLSSEPHWQVLCYDSVGSTMDVAKDNLGIISLSRPMVVLAKEQTKGRGRHGSIWAQPALGMYATFAFNCPVPTHNLSGLSLACGCALRKVLTSFDCELKLKWPNDLLSKNGHKLCGVLIELSTNCDLPGVLIGVGVNIRGAPEEVEGVTSVEELTGKIPSPVEIVQAVCPELWSTWQQFLVGGFSAFRAEWLANASGLGQPIMVESGGRTYEGTFVDVASDGALIIKDQQGVLHSLVSGHVTGMVRGG